MTFPRPLSSSASVYISVVFPPPPISAVTPRPICNKDEICMIFSEKSPFYCFARCSIISAAILIAISSGVSARIGSPIGEWTRAKSVSV